MRRSHPTLASATLALFPVLLWGCGSDGPSPDAPPSGTAEAAEAAGGAAMPAASPASAAPLTPAATFPIQDAGQVTGIALSPDGATVLVSTQERLGTPVTLRLYAAMSGQVLATAQVSTIGLGKLHWMADNRVVSADRDGTPGWRIWDGATLQEGARLPQDVTCAEGRANRNTGAIYSTDGMVGMGDVICRLDTRDGSMVRSAAGLLARPDQFWVRSGSNEVVVLHSPNPEESMELITLDGTSLTRTGSSVIQFGEMVEAVGATAWISREQSQTLEPGGIAAPDLGPVRASGTGAYFIHSNGMEDFVIVSAMDGSLVGSMPAGMNLSVFADWSIDDSVFARLTLDRGMEIYRL